MKGLKTTAFGVLTALLSLLSTPEMAAWVAEYLPFVGTALGVAIVWLRYLTNSPIFKKE